MKTTKKFLAIALVIVTMLSFSVPAFAATSNQQVLQSVATIYRDDLGYPDDHAAVRIMQISWHVENGSNAGQSYYYSDIMEGWYYFNGNYGNYVNGINSTQYSNNRRQQKAAEAYNMITGIYGQSHPATIAALDVFKAECGTSAAYSFTHDNLYGTTDAYYYFSGSRISGNRGTGNAGTSNAGNGTGNGQQTTQYDNNSSLGYSSWNGYTYYNGWLGTSRATDVISRVRYTYGQDTLYQYASDTSKYFRVSYSFITWASDSDITTFTRYGTVRNLNLTAGDAYYRYNGNLPAQYNYAVTNGVASGNGTTGNGTGNGQNGNTGSGQQQTQQQNYKFYADQNYYAGILTGTDKYVDLNNATVLAKMIGSYMPNETSVTRLAAMGWIFINYCGGRVYSDCVSSDDWRDYNPNAATTVNGIDLNLLAKDLLFRKAAEYAGVQNVGRILPSDYSRIWIQGGTVYFRNGEYGYDHTYDWTFSDNNYRSPYNS